GGGAAAGRPGDGCLRAGGDAVRIADRAAAVPGREPAGDLAAGDAGGAGAGPPPSAEGAAGSGDDLPQMPPEGAGQALRQCRGAGGRPGPVSRWPTDPRPANLPLGAGGQVGAAAAGGGGGLWAAADGVGAGAGRGRGDMAVAAGGAGPRRLEGREQRLEAGPRRLEGRVAGRAGGETAADGTLLCPRHLPRP